MTTDMNRSSGLAGESAMHQAAKLLWNFVDDDSGMTAIEYALIASIISIAIIIGAMQVATNIQVILAQAVAY
jgi:Flp pilus assembly pilin Flp